MRVSYYRDSDTLYIDLKEVPGADIRECMDDFVLDVDAEGKPVGIEIQHASETVDLSHVQAEGLNPMRISYDPLGSSHDPPSVEFLAPGASAATNVHMRVVGNGESARIVSDIVYQQTEELLR